MHITETTPASTTAPRPPRFVDWLHNQRHRDDPFGDFAEDTERAGGPDIPDTVVGLAAERRAWASHLNQHRACREARRAFSEAWVEYSREALHLQDR